MLLSEFINQLDEMEKLTFRLINGKTVKAHFHLTEMGLLTRQTVDCGGNIHRENRVVLQLWEANDIFHRLTPQKMKSIAISASKSLEIEDVEIEIEYQTQDTIGKYALSVHDDVFVLESLNTTCMAGDSCGVPVVNQLSTCCSPDSNCC